MLKKSKLMYCSIIVIAIFSLVIGFKIRAANAKVNSLPNQLQGTWVSKDKTTVNYMGSKKNIWDGMKLKLNANHAQTSNQTMESQGHYSLGNHFNFTSIQKQSHGFWHCVDQDGNVVYLRRVTIHHHGHSEKALYYTVQENKKDGKLLYRQN